MRRENNGLFSAWMTHGLRAAGLAAFAAFAWAGWLVGQAPVEKNLLVAQKIFYVHLPSAWCAFAAFLVVFLASVAFLWTRRAAFDAWAASAAEVGVVFTTAVLLTGSVWARTAWGVWWTWDVRLTTMLILWFVYVGYLVLRGAFAGHDRMPAFAAVYGVLGFLDVPIVHISVRLVETQHPAVLKRSGGGGLDPAMAKALGASTAAFALFFLLLLAVRVRQEMLKRRLEAAEEA